MTNPTVNPSSRPGHRRGLVVAWILLLAYLVFFFSCEQFHRTVCWLLLVPDDLVIQWVGADWSRFSLLDRIPLLLLVTILMFAAWAWGCILLRPLGISSELLPAERKLFSLAVGLSFLSLCTLALGWAGLLQVGSLFLVVLGVAPLLEVVLRRCFSQPAQPARRLTPAEGSLSRRWLWLLLPLALIVLWGAMLPPQDFDVREYHLQVPKEWYLNGRVEFLPHNVYGNMPLGSEVLSIPAMAIWPGENDWWWGALVGKTILASFGLLTAWAVYLFGCRWFSSTAALVSTIVFLGTPWVLYVCMNGLVEVAAAFYGLMALYATLLWRQRPERLAWAGLAGFLAGSAVACKYPAILLVVFPLLIYLAIQAGRRRPAVLAVFLVAVSLGCGLWFAKNLAMTGNPTYPLLGSWFGGETGTVARHEQWQQAHQVPRDLAGRRYSLPQLWDSLSHFAGRSQRQSPLLIPLALLGFTWCYSRGEVFWVAALIAYTFLTWWLLTHRIERFWVPMLPLLALLAGLGGERLCRSAPTVVLPLVLLFATLFGALAGSSQLLGDNRFFVGLEQLRDGPPVAGEFEDTHHGDVHRYLNRHVPSAGGRVLLVGDAEPFDLRVPVLYNTCFDQSVFEQLMRDRDAQQRLAVLRRHEITHVFVYWHLIDRYREPGNYGFTDYVTRDFVQQELVQTGILHPLLLEMPAEVGILFKVGDEVLPGSTKAKTSQERP